MNLTHYFLYNININFMFNLYLIINRKMNLLDKQAFYYHCYYCLKYLILNLFYNHNRFIDLKKINLPKILYKKKNFNLKYFQD